MTTSSSCAWRLEVSDLDSGFVSQAIDIQQCFMPNPCSNEIVQIRTDMRPAKGVLWYKHPKFYSKYHMASSKS